LAALVEVDAAIISRLENGIILPGEKIRRRLAAALGVPEDFLSIIEEGKADD
jgi:transcriptional regulator with XRE-family HTH domain